MITVKTEKEIELMRESGQITKKVLDLIGQKIKPGMSTKDLDKIAYDFITSCGATFAIGILNWPNNAFKRKKKST